MKKKRIITVASLVFFTLLAFSVSYKFANAAIELTCLLTGLIGTVATASMTIFSQKVWKESHGPVGIKYEEAFKLLIGVIFSLIILNAALSLFHLIPTSFDTLKFALWIIGYSAMVSPNLAYIFSEEVGKDSIA